MLQSAFLTPLTLSRSTAILKPHPFHIHRRTCHLTRPLRRPIQIQATLSKPSSTSPSTTSTPPKLPLHKTFPKLLKTLLTYLHLRTHPLRNYLNTLRKNPLTRLTFSLLLLLTFRHRLPFTPTPTTTTPLATIATPSIRFPNFLSKFTAPKLLRPFTEAFGVVFLSEFGDKSMFATALMAMKQNPLLVFLGALLSLTFMTFIACFLGQFMKLLPVKLTHYSTIALFIFFGLQMIWQARNMSSSTAGEKQDAEELVKGVEDGKGTVLAKVCSLIFVAEWCDRSMLATMALAGAGNTLAVVGGATAANVLCTGLAVVGAAAVSKRISEKVVAMVSGVLFQVFALFTFLEGPDG